MFDLKNMMNNKKNYITGKRILFALLVLVFFIAGFAVGKSSSAKAVSWFDTQAPEGVDFSQLWEAWNILDDKFVPTKPDNDKKNESLSKSDRNQKRIWGMIEGLAASTDDPYTVFLPPSQNKLFQEDISGEFEGVGMEIAIKDGVLTVVSPLKDTPAFRAGIKAGDRILKIDGISTENIDIEKAVSKIRGPKGSFVSLTVLRESEPDTLEIKIKRDTIKIPTIESKKLQNNIYLIELASFTDKSPELFAQALVDFTNSKSDKLILDLRGNPGGYLDAAVDIASWFLPKGAVVVSEDFGSKRPEIVHRSRGYNIFKDKKVVVLIDKGSASASEILAGALRAHKKAVLIGKNSFGKGSVQELIPMKNGTSFKVTVARWVLPDGSWIMGEGIKPDIEVEFPKKEELICNPKKREEFEKKDLILDRAIEYLINGK